MGHASRGGQAAVAECPVNSGPVEESDDTISGITGRLRFFREEREWARFHTPRNLAVSVAIESAELLEHFQWLAEDGSEDGPPVDEVAHELADVAIYVFQLADRLGVSLPEAIESKIERNTERYPVEKARGSSKKYTELR